jgi:hypothetical protein
LAHFAFTAAAEMIKLMRSFGLQNHSVEGFVKLAEHRAKVEAVAGYTQHVMHTHEKLI